MIIITPTTDFSHHLSKKEHRTLDTLLSRFIKPKLISKIKPDRAQKTFKMEIKLNILNTTLNELSICNLIADLNDMSLTSNISVRNFGVRLFIKEI